MRVPCWGNQIIRVDLESSTVTRERAGEEVRKRFLSGRGLGDWLLFNAVEPGRTDPLGPENALVFTSGLLLGTNFPGAVRSSLVSLNPLTGGYGESSAAGRFAENLKRAGCDALVVRGKAPEPVYIWIKNGSVEIRHASRIAGRSTFESAEMIKAEVREPRASTCTIGPAGERLVRYALVNCDNRYHGRCGMGAVMGSKNLKAVAVLGTGAVEVRDRGEFDRIAARVRDCLSSEPGLMEKARYGLGKDTEAYNDMGLLFTKNYQEVGFDAISGIGYDAVKRYYKRVIPCPTDCPVSCNRLVGIDEGEPYGGTSVESLEATPMYNMAHLCVDDIRTVIKAFALCNGYGIDMHAWSTCMQWAIECYERGILARGDTDGLDLRWGDGPLLLESIRRVAYREGGFCNLLAEGVARASRTLGRGSEEYAMHLKGMEIDDELRVDKGMSFGVLTDPRGPTHTLSAFFGGFDASLTPVRAKRLYGTENAAIPAVYDDKADLVVHTERYAAMQDCLGICWFASHRAAPQLIERYDMGTYAAIIAQAVGWSVSERELVEIAERVLALEKSINVLSGQTRADEYPPGRFFEKIPGGPSGGMALSRESLEVLFRRHSALHRWDPQTGIPLGRTLEELGISEVARRLESAGKSV
jgi:aldehyde:ferredoxin oxidoreductase